MEDLAGLEKECTQAVADAADLDALEEVRVALLGKKGRVSLLMRGLGKMPAEERQQVAPRLNELKTQLTEAIGARKKALGREALSQRLEEEKPDVEV